MFQHTIGCSERGYQDGSFQEAKFSSPQGVILCDNNIFVADTDNHVIRKVGFNYCIMSHIVRKHAFEGFQFSKVRHELAYSATKTIASLTS